jgi:hypothetical protein
MTFRALPVVFAVACWALASVAGAAPRVWSFSAFLDDRPIGHHRFTLTGPDDARDMSIETGFNARFYGVFPYHYVHEAHESWRGNCLARLSARTDDDGHRSQVAALPDEAGLRVQGPRGERTLSGCVMSYAYWNPLILQQQWLLNPQTGELDPVAVSALGTESLVVHGVLVSAHRYRLMRGGNIVELWYSETGDWLALASSLGGGRRLRYQRD